MKIHKLAEEDGHVWYAFGREADKASRVIDTNEYLIVSNGEGVLLDPGGTETFPYVVSAISGIIPVQQVSHFFASHQDPDVFSSLPLWMGLCPDSKIYMWWGWQGFLAHYGHEYVDSFVPLEDGGSKLVLKSGRELQFIPAHYLHSSGNYHVYDPTLKILFTGDVGAALLPVENDDLFVRDFDAHIGYMEGFHKRWMPSNRAKNNWISRVRQLEIKYLCPQHGSIFQGEDVAKFLDWFETLQVGAGVE